MARGFSEQGFWRSLQRAAAYAGREVVEKALTLYFAAQQPETPLWAKTVIYSALAYFILPTDAIPDFVLFTGYADDLSTLAAALGAVAMAITPEVKAAAKQKVIDWFGDGTEAPSDSVSEANAIREIVIE